MMNARKKATLVGVTLGGIALVATMGTGIASAHGMGGVLGDGFGMRGSTDPAQMATALQTQFQNEATMLGISVDEVKAGWASGKSMEDLAAAHGITQTQLKQKIDDARSAHRKSQLQALVDKGVITQAQADQRLQTMQTMKAKFQNTKGLHGKKGTTSP